MKKKSRSSKSSRRTRPARRLNTATPKHSEVEPGLSVSAIATAEARAFAHRMSLGKIGEEEFWPHCLGQGFFLPFADVPGEVDIGDLDVLYDHVTPDRYSALEGGATPSKEETRLWTELWIKRRLSEPTDYGVENIDVLRFTSSDSWSGVLILGCHPAMLENAAYYVHGLYESLDAAIKDLKRSGHLKLDI
jgi:hypothetical protein